MMSKTLTFTAALFFFAIRISAQTNDPGSFFQTLLTYDSLHIHIETDLAGLRSQNDEEIWQPGQLRIVHGDSVVEQHNIQISTRGRMRKQTCKFPPVKLRLDDTPFPSDSIAAINELKLVIACNENKLYEKLVLKEHLVYQMYNALTDKSFRTKSAYILFTDAAQKKDSYETYAFFIESEKELSARLSGRPLKSRIVPPQRLDPFTYNLMCIFEYMIGNTDWSPKGRHNVKLISLRGQHPLPAPYDFDYAGIVNAPYAIPAHDLPIKSVRERYFMGLCRKTGDYQPVFDLFLQRKSALFEIIQQAGNLPEKDRKDMTDFLQDFYDILESPQRTKRSLLDQCIEED